jgi:hypothetical protein
MTIEEALRSLAEDDDAPIRADENNERAIVEVEGTIGAKLDPIGRRYLQLVPREPTGQWEEPRWMRWDYWSGLTIREMLEQRKRTLEDVSRPESGAGRERRFTRGISTGEGRLLGALRLRRDQSLAA